ncbi:MAG TPA: Fe-S protein assembly chaperone HscA [Haliangiales bacterium]|nr:Fe-S protein assembly chaperone HscA [Haliangiales bacterium]
MTLFQISEPGQSRIKEHCAARAVGIDLGTTNSLVAAVRDGEPRVLCDAEGRALLPSVVHYGAEGGTIVGWDAKARAADFPHDTIVSVKRFMGRGPKDAEAQRKLTPYELAGDGPVVRFRVPGREVTPIEVSAEILRTLRERAEAELDGPLDGAVITVPAYFDDAQRQATRDAGRLAGLEVLRLLNEPTAAALAYGLDKGSRGTYAVYDFGGGTFDISILKLEDGVFEVKATGGDTALGGDDFDRAIAEKVLAEMGWGGDKAAVRRVLDAARTAREALTAAETAEIAVGTFRRTLARAEVEAWIRPIVDRTGPTCRRALKDAGVAPGELDGVILVGGATRTPLVRRFVASTFGREPLGDIDPDQVVALGAAVQADILAGGRRDDVLLLDVIPLSLGLETMGGVVERLIPRNSTIPAGATQTFTTFADNQTGYDIHVVQGERDTVEHCRSLARFNLKGLPPMPAGMARAEITFLVDADGILHVTAREETTGIEAAIDVKPSYGLTDEEVERMLLDSYEHAEEDKQARLLLGERVDAERVLAATRAAMRDDAALLTDEWRAAMDAGIADLAAKLAGADHRAIHEAIEALDRASQPFAEARMNRALERGMRGRRIEDVERL